MMYYFVVAAFLLFLFVFWYLSDSVRALERDMNTQMKYTTQSTADYVYYRLNRVAFSADALKTSVSPIMYETNDPYEEYREIRNALMTTLMIKCSPIAEFISHRINCMPVSLQMNGCLEK